MIPLVKESLGPRATILATCDQLSANWAVFHAMCTVCVVHVVCVCVCVCVCVLEGVDLFEQSMFHGLVFVQVHVYVTGCLATWTVSKPCA